MEQPQTRLTWSVIVGQAAVLLGAAACFANPAFEALEPAPGAVVSIDSGSRKAVKELTLKWRSADGRPDPRVRVRLQRQEPPVTWRNDGEASARVTLGAPGTYSWELRREGRSVARFSFELSPRYEGIEMLRPLVSGQVLDSNQVDDEPLRKFSLRLGWVAYEGARSYEVRFGGRTYRTREPGWLSGLTRVPAEPIRYEILARLPSGFTVSSGPQEFDFRFLPPLLLSPRRGDTLRMSEGGPDLQDGALVLKWKPTHFTRAYEVELAFDEAFAEVARSLSGREPMARVAGLRAGTYYWRVRSVGDGVRSPFSDPHRITLAP